MSALIDRALIFATEKHAGQTRRYDGRPYVFHPIAVAMLVMETPGHTEDMVAAALLHDVVEDCGVLLAEVGQLFGPEVQELVYWLTDTLTPLDGNRGTRKRLEREKWSRCENPGAKTVKLADLIDNFGSIVVHDPQFAAVYLDEKRQMLPFLAGGDPGLMQRALAAVGL